MTDYTWLMICDGTDCQCAETADVNDTVVTPDGPGVLEVRLRHTATVRLNREDGNGDVWRQVYPLSTVHLTESAAAMKDA